MQFLGAADKEIEWAKQHGSDQLHEKLLAAGAGIITGPARDSKNKKSFKNEPAPDPNSATWLYQQSPSDGRGEENVRIPFLGRDVIELPLVEG